MVLVVGIAVDGKAVGHDDEIAVAEGVSVLGSAELTVLICASS